MNKNAWWWPKFTNTKCLVIHSTNCPFYPVVFLFLQEISAVPQQRGRNWELGLVNDRNQDGLEGPTNGQRAYSRQQPWHHYVLQRLVRASTASSSRHVVRPWTLKWKSTGNALHLSKSSFYSNSHPFCLVVDGETKFPRIYQVFNSRNLIFSMVVRQNKSP